MSTDTINFETGRIPTLFRKILIPTLLGTLALSAVTAIDGIFIGHGVGAEGVAAVNIIVPIYQIMSGLGLMVGAGCSVVASIFTAQKNNAEARKNISHAIVISSAITILLTIVILSAPTYTARLLGASETLMPPVLDYLKWIMPCFVFEMWSLIGLFIIRIDGSPRYAMWCNIIPGILNAILDWLCIFPLGMGVKGAAIATTTSIMVGGIMALIYLLFFAKDLRLQPVLLNRGELCAMMDNLRRQCTIGSSTLFGELTLAVLIFIGNLVFMRYLGDAGVGAFGIACYYTPFFFMVGNSVAQSAQPIISYNYGRNRWTEVSQTRRLLITTSLGLGALVTLLFTIIPQHLVALFVDIDSEAGRIAIDGFPYYATGIIFFIVNISIIGYYQSIEQIKQATALVFLRGFIFLIPSFILLPALLNIKGIWLAMPAAELITTIVIALSLIKRKI